MRTWLRALLAAAGFGLSFGAPATGTEIGAPVRLTGAASVLAWHTTDQTGGTLDSVLARLRLELDGAGPSSLGGFSWNLMYDTEALAGGIVRSPAFAARAATPEPTALDLDRRLAGGGAYRWTHRLARASVEWQAEGGRAILGRQRIGWGSGRIWRPTDRFQPASPTGIGASEAGIDALFVERYAGPFGALQLAAAPGKGSRNAARKLAVRWRDTLGETDYALLAARIGRERVAGLDLAANVGGGLLYVEAAAGWPRDGARYVQAVTGYDTAWSPRFLEGPLSLGVEYFRNTASSHADSTARPADRLRTRREHQLAVSVGYGLGLAWELSSTVLLEPDTGSRAVLPRITWAPTQDVEWSLLAQLYAGGPESEYGNMPDLFALQVTMYF